MESLEQLYNNYSKIFYRFAVGLTGNTDEAEDIVQTVFTRLAMKKDLMVSSIHKAYLFSAVRNGTKDYWKRKKSVPLSRLENNDDEGNSVPVEIVDSSVNIERKAEVTSSVSLILTLLPLLTLEQQEIISLKYFGELSTTEISQQVGKSENTIRQMEFRALRSLRKLLKEKYIYE